MKKYDLIKNKISKYAFEIIKNVEMICFLSKSYIKSYSKFLKNKFSDENELKLYNFLKKWFDKDAGYYNYYELFNNSYLNECIQHFYATNNIEESLQNKINIYIPNKKNN